MSRSSIWMDLDALAASYSRVHGVWPDRLVVGEAVARELEGDADRRRRPDWPVHPPHQAWERAPGVQTVGGEGYWRVSCPQLGGLSAWQRWHLRRDCRHQGGHFWHPEGAMIDWFCCFCGKQTDGMPEDGSRW
jgi:hypothetical protein